MCGICGVFLLGLDNFAEVKSPVEKMMSLMRRRGPDDEGYWQNARCAFGFRRLAILDLSSNGHQPMLTPDERYCLVFNGEIYNFQFIRLQLKKCGWKFRSTGDAEVVLYALVEWGVGALDKFNGMFALAFYDNLKHTLLIARDHAGIKPLYYLHTTQGLVFGSQYNQIISHPWAKGCGISQSGLALYLHFGYIPAPYALHNDVHLLDAGSWVTINSDNYLEQGYYYHFPQYSSPSLQGDKAIEALDEAVCRAVSRHLISDVPVGVFLSGGIDSPLVASEARRNSNTPLKAFSIGVFDSEMDESEDAKNIARELEFEHILRQIDDHVAMNLLDKVTEACSEPLADYSIFPTLLVSEIAAEHVKVVLSGDGGDEPFWGYPTRFGETLKQSRYYAYPRWLRYGFIGMRHILGVGTANRDSLWPSIGRLFQKKHSLLSEEDLRSVFPKLGEMPSDLDLFNYQGTDIEETAQWLRWNEFRLHLARILLKVDRASMFHSLEVRVPLLDKEVLAVAQKLDWRSCLDVEQNLGKIPLRKLLARRVNYQTQQKRGFTVPMYAWLRGPWQPLLQEKLLSQKGILGQPVDVNRLKEMNQKLLVGDSTKARGLWLLLSLVLWEEYHLKHMLK